jgi:hypothetical protein
MKHKIFGGIYIRLAMATTPDDMSQQYPGFPSFVHVIMAEIANGATVEEASAAVTRFNVKDHIQNAIDRSAAMPSDLRLAHQVAAASSSELEQPNNFLA